MTHYCKIISWATFGSNKVRYQTGQVAGPVRAAVIPGAGLMHAMVAACRDSFFTIRSQECADVPVSHRSGSKPA